MSIVFVLIIFIYPLSAFPQYFGRNKVQYEDFNFKVLETENFKIYYYPKESEAVKDAAQLLERWYERYIDIFGYEFPEPQPVILYANHPDFQQTNVIMGLVPQGTQGVTEGLKNRIVIPLANAYSESNHVLGHELVHAFHYRLMKAVGKGLSAANRIPLWFIEGMSEYLSVGEESALTAMWMRDAVLHDDVPEIDDITRGTKYFPYRYGHSIWAHLAGTEIDSIVPKLFAHTLKSGWQKGFKNLTNYDVDSLSNAWRVSLEETYLPQIEGRTKPSEIGETIITGEGGMNLAPVISPDGEYLVYLSRRDIFTLDLYLADAHTGEVIKKLVSSNTDSHFDALSFMNSSGSWSPDGEKFAFIILEEGDNQIAILDVSSKEIQRKIRINDVTSISHISWSPDNEMLAVAGTCGGINDLYLYNLKTDKAAQLTDDRFTELQPSWSPDANTLAFVTDRGGETDFETFLFGKMKIALYDLKSKNMEIIAISDYAKHINPQFSPDGKQLYLVADPDGVSDVYRYSLEEKEFYRITNIATGISGLTELSPCMSVAQNSGRMVFSVFEKTNHNIYALDSDHLSGESFSPTEKDYLATVSLPPFNKFEEGRVDRYLNNKVLGLMARDKFDVSDYDPSLKLIHVGQTTIGVSVDRYGTGLGGSTNLLFSDMLGNHMLAVAAQINGGIKDLGGQVLYVNRDNRFNWGASVGHIPYQTARMYSRIDTFNVDGEDVLARELELIRRRVFVDRFNLLSEYPLSLNRRFEMGLGYTRISYDEESERELISPSGQVLLHEEKDVDAPAGLNLFHGNVAYVGDYSFFGFTSPVRGKRYRLEAEQTVGSLKYLTFLADYRHYFFWNPVTLAFRSMHYGRYLGDAENDNLSALSLGYETWVRGYSLDSFEMSECTETGDPNRCPEYDRLIGSKVGVMNLELRVPLLGNEQFGLIDFDFLPTQLSAFLDGGVAWTDDDSPTFELTEKSTERIPVFSTGLAARFNLLGYLVGQVYYAYPFQRPEKGAHFGFLLAPGW